MYQYDSRGTSSEFVHIPYVQADRTISAEMPDSGVGHGAGSGKRASRVGNVVRIETTFERSSVVPSTAPSTFGSTPTIYHRHNTRATIEVTLMSLTCFLNDRGSLNLKPYKKHTVFFFSIYLPRPMGLFIGWTLLRFFL